MKKYLLATLLVCIFCLFTQSTSKSKRTRNIILMIGDGMGLAQSFAAYTVNGGQLVMYTFPYVGLSKTSASDNYITDSAAGATALSCGEKTKNGRIGTDTVGNKLKSILEYAIDHKLATGLISTSAITHATPACFISHQPDRNMYEEIAADFLLTDIDLFIGGGINHFTKRKDGRNLRAELVKKGYDVYFSIDSSSFSKKNKLALLTAAEHNPKMSEGRKDMLEQSVKIAVDRLSKNKNGFFLMVEGSMIDWGNHANDADYSISETVDFDKAVGKALEFAKKDGNTIVIVLADHESGGMTITGGSIKGQKAELKYATKEHTPVPVPVFAYGPGAENFAGVYENTEIFYKMMRYYGFIK